MEETERAHINEDFLQGDILRLVDHNSDYDFNLAMIINADCDMQNKKHDGVIAVLPIYTFQQYLQKFWLQNFLLAQKNEAMDIIASTISIEDRHIADLCDWIKIDGKAALAKGASKIFERYEPNVKQLKRLDDALTKLHNAIVGQSEGSLTAVSKFGPDDKEKLKKYCRDQVLDAKKKMGDGHFFITEVKSDDSIGYVVRMRRIYSLAADICFISNSSLQSSGIKGKAALRICRLTPHYKFKVSQLFAYQYSRIGLPDDTSALSELAIADMAFHFQGDKTK
jgi:hypothetical protein